MPVFDASFVPLPNCGRSLFHHCCSLFQPITAAALLSPLTQAQAWGAWWALTLYARYVRCLAAKRPFRTQAWSRLPVGPPRLRAAPLEPLIKVLLPLMGVLGGEGVRLGQVAGELAAKAAVCGRPSVGSLVLRVHTFAFRTQCPPMQSSGWATSRTGAAAKGQQLAPACFANAG